MILGCIAEIVEGIVTAYSNVELVVLVVAKGVWVGVGESCSFGGKRVVACCSFRA